MRLWISFFLAIALALSVEAFACTCGGIPDTDEGIAKIAASSDAVFLGRIEEATHRVWAAYQGNQSELSAKARVIEAFKGTSGQQEITIWTDVGSTCSAGFDPGRVYLFFASRSSDESRLYTTRCSAFPYIPIDADPDKLWPRETIEMALEALRALY